jgi:VanZ family protein
MQPQPTPFASMRALHWPRAWLALWALMLATVVVLSLFVTPPLPDIPDSDKFGHCLAYASLAAMAVQLFAPRATLVRVALALVLLGIALEFLQGLTPNRTPDPLDALANTCGVLLGMSLALTPLRDALSWIERPFRRAPR